MPLARAKEVDILAHFGSFGGPNMYDDDSEPDQALDANLAEARMADIPKPAKSENPKKAQKKDAATGDRRMLRPIPGVNHAALQKGDEISYRHKKGKEVCKMRVISPGLPWQEPAEGCGDVTNVGDSQRHSPNDSVHCFLIIIG